MIATSPDGQWAVIRRGRELSLLAGGAGPATAQVELPSDDADLAIVGPPSVVVAVTRGEPGPRMMLYQPPSLEAVARLDLDTALRIAAITGPRVVLVSPDGKMVIIVRIAGRALSTQIIDPQSPVEFAVGLDRNQVLFGLLRKLEAWDAVSARPLLRMQLALPPPPRVIGAAQGHVWAMQAGGDSIVVSRLSDGRPFHHPLGVSIDEVIAHPASPLLVLVTPRGLIRLHCFAHSVTVIDAPWQPGTSLAQLVVGDDIRLLGVAPGQDSEPWRVPIGGSGVPAIQVETAAEPATGKPRTPRDRTGQDGTERAAGTAPVERPDRGQRPELGRCPEPGQRPEPAARIDPGQRPERPERLSIAGARPVAVPAPPPPAPRPTRSREWREPLAVYGAELARGGDAELPVVAAESKLGQLVQRLELPAGAHRALIALYSLYLIGDPAVAIARLARALGDWTEPLGQGELEQLAMLRRRNGKVALRGAVTDLLDGASPRSIRMVGDAAAVARPGAARMPRDGRSDAAIEHELAIQFGRIAVIEGATAPSLLETRLHGATAVALAPPTTRPLPWPRDAGLVVVTGAAEPTWVTALPVVTAA